MHRVSDECRNSDKTLPSSPFQAFCPVLSRELITRVALYRFKDSPIWGHGVTNKGTQLLAHHPPVGTHNTIVGLLYVKGLIGLVAFVTPMIISLSQLSFRVLKDQLNNWRLD
jgi:O-antigen ligase